MTNEGGLPKDLFAKWKTADGKMDRLILRFERDLHLLAREVRLHIEKLHRDKNTGLLPAALASEAVVQDLLSKTGIGKLPDNASRIIHQAAEQKISYAFDASGEVSLEPSRRAIAASLSYATTAFNELVGNASVPILNLLKSIAHSLDGFEMDRSHHPTRPGQIPKIGVASGLGPCFFICLTIGNQRTIIDTDSGRHALANVGDLGLGLLAQLSHHQIIDGILYIGQQSIGDRDRDFHAAPAALACLMSAGLAIVNCWSATYSAVTGVI